MKFNPTLTSNILEMQAQLDSTSGQHSWAQNVLICMRTVLMSTAELVCFTRSSTGERSSSSTAQKQFFLVKSVFRTKCNGRPNIICFFVVNKMLVVTSLGILKMFCIKICDILICTFTCSNHKYRNHMEILSIL